MEAAEFETDALLKLLTDAIRRGPGSPEWHDAVEKLRGSGAQGADEYRLLMDVRDRLESGRSYREVTAGPQFTKELFEQIEKPAAVKSPTVLKAAIYGCLVVLVLSAIAVTYIVINSNTATHRTTDKLASRLFTRIIKEWPFSGTLPSDLKQTGTLKTSGTLRIDNDKSVKLPASGAVTADQKINVRDSICVESVIQFRPGGDTQFALVLAEENNDDSRLAVQLSDQGFAVRHGGEVTQINKTLPQGSYTLRIKTDLALAIVEVDGQQIWSGRHGLPEQVVPSLRFSRQTDSGGEIRVDSLRVLAP